MLEGLCLPDNRFVHDAFDVGSHIDVSRADFPSLATIMVQSGDDELITIAAPLGSD